jgi:hypothetical protein
LYDYCHDDDCVTKKCVVMIAFRTQIIIGSVDLICKYAPDIYCVLLLALFFYLIMLLSIYTVFVNVFRFLIMHLLYLFGV